jgi:hypothetical protein
VYARSPGESSAKLLTRRRIVTLFVSDSTVQKEQLAIQHGDLASKKKKRLSQLSFAILNLPSDYPSTGSSSGDRDERLCTRNDHPAGTATTRCFLSLFLRFYILLLCDGRG